MNHAGTSIARDAASIERRRALLQSELERIRAALARIPSIHQVLVFGSVASGAVHEWSDLDLLVVQDTDARFLDRVQALTDLTMPLVGTQFLVYTPRELAEMAYRPFVRHEILRKGKALPMDPNKDAERWLAFAAEDVRVARWALSEEIWNQACFHAQQCVEKCLKALLTRTGQLVPRTHIIVDLWLAQATETRQTLSDLEAPLRRLDRFYLPVRYPDTVPGSLAEGLPQREDAQEALAAAEECLTRARSLTKP